MVRLGGLTAAHNARLRSDELQMIFVANSSRCTQQESCFVYSLYSTLIPALVRAVDGSLAVVRFCRSGGRLLGAKFFPGGVTRDRCGIEEWRPAGQTGRRWHQTHAAPFPRRGGICRTGGG